MSRRPTHTADTQPMLGADIHGLSEHEAAKRLAERPQTRAPGGSRSYGSIVRANVFTVFNLILAVFGALTLAFGDWRDGLFLAILVVNTGIGIGQEVRAKQALDRLAALVAPVATVVRDGRARSVPVEEVVTGDLLRLSPGDQVVADGRLEAAQELAVDESILTGESAPAVHRVGDRVRSGSFVVEGTAAYVVEAVGAASYAERVAGEARAFRHPRSPLEQTFNQLLLALVAIMIPLGAALGYSLWERSAPIHEAVSTSVAAVVSLVPEGLIVLASVTYAVAALRMARRGALAQQLNAVESLASAEVICLDKTGTLTDATLRVIKLISAGGVDERGLQVSLGRFAASMPSTNPTLAAVAEMFAHPAEAVGAHVPFSSSRRWSGLRLSSGAYVLGAPELFDLSELEDQARQETRAGRRVVAFATTKARFDGPVQRDSAPPADAHVQGLVVLSERLRPEARAAVGYFRSQGVTLKVLSGDAPETVAAIATDAGIPSADGPVDGRDIPRDRDAMQRAVGQAAVVGRISPEGKRAVVERLRADGRYVTMVGDGVNDVPALKQARLAIAQGTGAQMAKSVADLVLVRGDFAALPGMVAEGRKILRNLQRVAKLYVTKSAFAAFLILTVGTTATAYPLLPRHFSIAATITIGIPSFVLALAPSAGRWQTKGFLRSVARFAVPAGTAAGIGVVASYQFALNALHRPLVEARTVATSVLVLVGLYLVYALESTGMRRKAAIVGLCVGLLALYMLGLVLPPTRSFFQLAPADLSTVLTPLIGAAIAIAALELTEFNQAPQLEPVTQSAD